MAGLGYSIMPSIGIKKRIGQWAGANHSAQRIPYTVDLDLICLKNKTLSQVAQAFISYIKKGKATNY